MTKMQPMSPILAESLVHGAHVAHLSKALFDGLAPLHKLSKKWRNILDLGAQLHDIGWLYGKKAHHKNSAAMIRTGMIREGMIREGFISSPELTSPLPLPVQFPPKLRPLVALVARYHRRADPSLQQEHFAKLSPQERHAIRILAAIIRLGDALDFSHSGSVKNVRVHLFENHIELKIMGTDPCLAEICRIDVKKALFCEIFHLDILCTYTKDI